MQVHRTCLRTSKNMKRASVPIFPSFRVFFLVLIAVSRLSMLQFASLVVSQKKKRKTMKNDRNELFGNVFAESPAIVIIFWNRV